MHTARRAAAGVAVIVLLLVLGAPGGATAAPFALTDINPDSSIVPQGRNNSEGGRVNALKVAAGQNQVAYAASEWGGIFKTTDGAQTWFHLDDHLPQATFDVDVDPSDTSIVYATSLYDGRADPRSGISVSDDGGATWTHPSVPDTSPTCASWDEPSAFGIGIVPDAPANVIVGTACGVAVSHDSGATWSHVDPDPSTSQLRIWDVVAQPGGIVDICGSDGHFRSVNSGDDWTPSTLANAGDVCSIAASPLESDVLYVTQNNVALWESRDAGANWTMLEDGPGNRRAFVVTNQTGPSSFDLYYGSGPKLRLVSDCDDSTVPTRCPAAPVLNDGPTLGTDITGNAHDDAGDLEFDPTDATPQCPYLYSNDGGVYRSDDCAPTWQRAMAGLHDTWLYDLTGAALAGNQTGLYYGQMDSGGWYSTDGGSSWGNPTCCDIWDVMADSDRVIFTQCCPTTTLRQAPADDPSNISPMTPPNAGAPNTGGWLQWFQQTDSMQPFATDSYVFVTQTKGNAAFEVAGGNGPGGIWITQDVGASYTQLGAATTPANACSVQVALSGGTPTFYVLTDDQLNGSPAGLCSGGGGHLFKYTGTAANGTWTPADTGLETVGIFGVDPNDPNRLYASDYTGSGPRMVFSTDGGASWEPDSKLDAMMTGDGAFNYRNDFGPEVRWFTPPLTGYAQPTMVAFHPTDPNVLIAGATDAGLFMSTDGGQGWAKVTGSLPRVWHHYFDSFDDSVFYVGTVGRGAWSVRLPDGDLSIEKSDDPDPAVAGEQLTYTLTVSNDGPDDVPNARVTDTLPEGVEYVSDDAGCDEGPARVLTCDLGTLSDDETQEIEIVVDVAADLVHEAGGPTTITNTATVAGVTIDPDPSDNTVNEDTDVVAVADLEIVSFEAVNPPAEILVGQPTEITLRKVITNNGPSAPMDVQLTTDATASPGTTVAPSQLEVDEPALGLDEQREVEEKFTVECQEASNHSFEFENTIAPADPADTDPDLSNNEATVTLDVVCVVPVTINIKPGGGNPINLGAKGVIPVAVLTTAAGEYGNPLAFDATTIDPTSVRFGPADAVFDESGGAFESHGKGHLEDSYELDEVTRDGDTDMVLHFKTQATGIGALDTEACVKGDWIDGGGNAHKFFGCDAISIVP
jgi:uncharacterized repeat protein (TIGR01451 family)